jgi:bifunctional aspartokinase / homoserine dehydrogenase 1
LSHSQAEASLPLGWSQVAILARESGLALELSDIPVESLVPEPLRALTTSAEYMARLPDFDADMGSRLEAARAAGDVLRYVGVVDVEVKV